MDKQDMQISYSSEPSELKETMINLIHQGKYIVQVIPIKNAHIILYNNH